MTEESRLTCQLNPQQDDWVIERDAFVLNRHQLGHDGKTPYRRVPQGIAPASQFEFEEQVLARFAPKRAHAKRKVAFARRSAQGTWVGIHEPIHENIIVLQSGKAVRARIVFRRFEGGTLEFRQGVEGTCIAQQF